MPTEPLSKLYALFGAHQVRAMQDYGEVHAEVPLACTACQREHRVDVRLQLRGQKIARSYFRVLDIPINFMACSFLPFGCSARQLSLRVTRGKTQHIENGPLALVVNAVSESRAPQAREPQYGRWTSLAEGALQRAYGSTLCSNITVTGRKFTVKHTKPNGSASLPLYWTTMEDKAGAHLRRLLVLRQLVTCQWIVFQVRNLDPTVPKLRDPVHVFVWYRVPSTGLWVSQRGSFALTWPRIRFKSPNKDNLNTCPRCSSGPPLQDRTPRMEDRSARIHVFCNQCENMWVVSLTRRAR